jgi:hypothetical protein
MNHKQHLSPTFSPTSWRRGRRNRGYCCTAERQHANLFVGILQDRAFTLLEVMIAVGVLFMCLFAILALLANSLTSARKLQQHQTIDTSTVAGLLYVQLTNTNQVSEGSLDLNIDEMYPGCKFEGDLTQIGTNGLCQIDFLVQHNQHLEVQSHFLIYLPNLKQGGISSSLPHH